MTNLIPRSLLIAGITAGILLSACGKATPTPVIPTPISPKYQIIKDPSRIPETSRRSIQITPEGYSVNETILQGNNITRLSFELRNSCQLNVWEELKTEHRSILTSYSDEDCDGRVDYVRIGPGEFRRSPETEKSFKQMDIRYVDWLRQMDLLED